MALKTHPDANRDDPDAHKKFMLVTKAHEILTDPKAQVCALKIVLVIQLFELQENMEKYGNPDGQQAMSITIGALNCFLFAHHVLRRSSVVAD